MAEQKAQHSCLRRLDEFMFCMSVTNQLSNHEYWKNIAKGRIMKDSL